MLQESQAGLLLHIFQICSSDSFKEVNQYSGRDTQKENCEAPAFRRETGWYFMKDGGQVVPKGVHSYGRYHFYSSDCR